FQEVAYPTTLEHNQECGVFGSAFAPISHTYEDRVTYEIRIVQSVKQS
ncbi:hypothetical protein AVEN_72128-1, partial [Araneus ventricosus]